MDVIKYFYEEPAALEVLTPNLEADARQRSAPSMPLDALLRASRYSRGYLAGTNLDAERVGLTAVAHPEAFLDPLLDWLKELRWMQSDGRRVRSLDAAAARETLRAPADTAVLVATTRTLPGEQVLHAVGPERRYALAGLRVLLEDARVVFFPEPAHHGSDWSFFSAHPMREALTAAFRRHPVAGVRRFALPYQKARGEHTFYFEAWQLDRPSLPPYVEEV